MNDEYSQNVDEQKDELDDGGTIAHAGYLKYCDRPNVIRQYSKQLDAEHSHYNDLLPSGNFHMTSKFLDKIYAMCLDYIEDSYDRGVKVVDFKHPTELKKIIDFKLDSEFGKSLSEIIRDCDYTLRYSVRTGHPRFFNQLSQGLDIISLVSEWITSAINTNSFTYEIAPCFMLMEEETLIKMRKCVGWENGNGDGVLCPGGSLSILYGVLLARNRRFPDIRTKGLMNVKGKPILFSSTHAHYSIKRAAEIAGFGSDNMIEIPINEKGSMKVELLEEKVKKSKETDGEIPFIVIAICGSTVLGCFDDLEAISNVCKKYNLWLHADAAWGGGALLSRKHRNLMKGIEKADSVTWNPHKLMGAHLQCAAFLCRHQHALKDCNAMNATYLYQKDKHYDVSYDTGDKTIQCGRRNDILKLWLMWRAKGDIGYEEHMNKLFELRDHFLQLIKTTDGFELLGPETNFLNICFFYIPKSLRKYKARNEEFYSKIHPVAPYIKGEMMNRGWTMISYNSLDDWPNFFRMAINNRATENDDLKFIIDEIQTIGENWKEGETIKKFIEK